MKRKALSLWSKVLAALLALFGITSCEDQTLVMYGGFPTDYRIKGTVTDTANNPIPDIRVVVEGWDYKKQLTGTDTLFTDSSGKIDEKIYGIIVTSDSVSIKIDDIDGEENGGEFQSEVLNPEVGYQQGSDGVYFDGVYFNATLKKK